MMSFMMGYFLVVLIAIMNVPLKNNSLVEVFEFRSAKQESYESLRDFYTRLRKLAGPCYFTDEYYEIKIQILMGTNNESLRKMMLRNGNIKLDEILSIGQTYDIVQDMNGIQPQKQEPQPQVLQIFQIHQSHPRRRHPVYKWCYACGHKWPHRGVCPAKGRMCHECGRPDHFSVLCKTYTDYRKKKKEDQGCSQS